MTTTALERNAFWVLGASTRDDRRRLIELADERSLTHDTQACQKARADLSNPRTRLTAELSWLPGLAPTRAAQLAQKALDHPMSITDETGLPALTHANLLAAAIERLGETVNASTMANLIQRLARLVSECIPDAIARYLNEDRSIAGFPPVTSELVTNELQERVYYYRTAIKECLDRIPTTELIKAITLVVDEATKRGSVHAPMLIDEVVCAYELESQSFLQQEATNIGKIVLAIESEVERKGIAVSQFIDVLAQVVLKWDTVAQPIQLHAQARGQQHEISRDVALSIRGLAITLTNKYSCVAESQRLTQLVQSVFAELPEVRERVEEDAATLQQILRAQEQTVAELEEWGRAITYQVEIGMVFKQTFRISPKGIAWKNKAYNLASITRVRWGGVRQSAGTQYTIAFGDSTSEAIISLSREQVFLSIVEKLWLAVGTRLSINLLENLRNGKELSFGDIVVRDDSVLLTKHKMFGNESVWCLWHDTKVWMHDGHFYIASSKDDKIYSSLSYINISNVHLLEHLIRTAYKHPNGFSRLSDILT
ncbi:MAG: hypothetical protein KIT40_17760 [Nitrospira sp.]|nr:hypothetical protein [Nitrospira sp.]